MERIESLKADVVIPDKRNRSMQREIDRDLYADRNQIERLFNRLVQYQRVARSMRRRRAITQLSSM